MFNLENIFLKSSKPQLTVAGVIVAKDKAESAMQALREKDEIEAFGFEDIGNDAAFIQFAEGATIEGATVLKMDENHALVVHNMKMFTPYLESDDFDSNLKAGSFYPSLYDASSALTETLGNILRKEETSEPPVEAAGAAIDRFKDYVLGLIGGLPSMAFKMDGLMEALTKAKEEPAGDPPAKEEEPAATTEKAEEEPEGGAETPEEEDPSVKKSEGAENAPAASEDPAAGAEAQVGAVDNQFQQLLDGFTAFKTSMEGSMDELRSSVGEIRGIAEKAEELATTAKSEAASASEAVNGTVHTSEPGDRQTTRGKKEGGRSFEDGLKGTSRKSEDGQATPHIEVW